jgi:hypothetical protein
MVRDHNQPAATRHILTPLDAQPHKKREPKSYSEEDFEQHIGEVENDSVPEGAHRV